MWKINIDGNTYETECEPSYEKILGMEIFRIRMPDGIYEEFLELGYRVSFTPLLKVRIDDGNDDIVEFFKNSDCDNSRDCYIDFNISHDPTENMKTVRDLSNFWGESKGISHRSFKKISNELNKNKNAVVKINDDILNHN